jgi:hypothetical protein
MSVFDRAQNTERKICSLSVTYFKLFGLVIQDVLCYVGVNKISA